MKTFYIQNYPNQNSEIIDLRSLILENSIELKNENALNELHRLDAKDRIVFMNQDMKEKIGDKKFGHRAIGVVYRPKYEYFGNYVPSEMPYRYNAFIYLDQTSALHPLHINPDLRQLPESYPFGV